MAGPAGRGDKFIQSHTKMVFTAPSQLFYTVSRNFWSYENLRDFKSPGVFCFPKLERGENRGKKIYVGNISFKASEEDLRELFSQSGQVESVKIITDKHTGNPKGFAFVEMATEEDAGKAINALNGTTFMDRTLSVAEARPQQPRERGFGGGRGFERGRR